MRKEFILLLLGIICMSTISSLFSYLFPTIDEKLLLDTVAGEVGAGNFSYWQLGHAGPLVVELNSLTGDADLYVSDTVRPSYEADKNNFSSVTCGPDLVHIPADFPRPIGIGVFGHWSSTLSMYSIQVYLDKSILMYKAQLRLFPPENGDADKRPRGKLTWKRNDDENSKPRLLKLLGYLDMIFDIFFM